MKYLYLFLIILLTSAAFSQSKTLYLKADNQFTQSKDSASIRLVIEGPGKDSLYTLRQYDVHDSILVSGTFKDSTITVQNGKFIFYYTPAESFAWRKANVTGADTNKYIKTIGYYADGKKSGTWSTYEINGDLQNTSTYTNDQQTGPARFIDNTPTGLSAHFYDGMYVNSKRDGEWKVTSLYNRLEETRYYHDDQLAKTVVNHSVNKGIIQPAAPKNFKVYLSKGLAAYAKSDPGKKIIVKLTVGKDGLTKNISIFSGYDDAVKNKTIVDLIKNSGKWKAGSIDRHVAEMTTFCTINTTPSLNYTLSKY
jgi:antitoxin component YwqK of YwqJK toxin-antitoxin module